MSIRGLTGWQTSLADLSLILFAVVAASYRGDPAEEAVPRPEEVEQALDVALGQPMAVFRPGGDADLTRWLSAQELDEGALATVIVRHRSGSAARAASEAARLADEIERAGHHARLVVETSAAPETLVTIAHDRPDYGTQIADAR